MKTAIVGSRGITDYSKISDILNGYQISEVISGGAKGVDSLAEQYACDNNIPTTIFKPDYKQYGRGACFVRNKQIIEASEQVIAFWDGESTGTLNSIEYAKKLNKPLFIYNM
jgi:predicted Rossmann fold nucleotide-binding protein DprA/Smf involved in DNA uptake